jgi:Ca-activated chloride channel family protein
MLLYTDGGDTHSTLRRSELIDLLKASDVTVYVIGALEHQSSGGQAEARTVLQNISDVTGGRAFFPSSLKELDRVYDNVVAEVRAQYTIGYVSTNEKTDGAWRKVEIRVRAPGGGDLAARSRKGYYATLKR